MPSGTTCGHPLSDRLASPLAETPSPLALGRICSFRSTNTRSLATRVLRQTELQTQEMIAKTLKSFRRAEIAGRWTSRSPLASREHLSALRNRRPMSALRHLKRMRMTAARCALPAGACTARLPLAGESIGPSTLRMREARLASLLQLAGSTTIRTP